MSAPNWLGLLRWTIANTQDGTHESQYSEMKAEDKEWLDKVMKEVVRDDPHRMNEVMCGVKDVLSRLEDGAVLSEDEFEKMSEDLEGLRDIVEQVDMAQVFAKFHGAFILIQVANNRAFPLELRALSLGVIATVAQNNLLTQNLFFEQGTLASELVKTFVSTDSFLVATKALLAISAVTRGHAAAEEVFLKDFAALVIPRALDSHYPNLINRLFFFVNALICSDYCTAGRIEKLVALLLPDVIEYVTSDISIDVRDNLLTLLYSLLHTEAAWNTMNHGPVRSVGAEGVASSSSGYKEIFLQALSEREQILQSISEEQLTAEDKALEMSKIQGLKIAVNELTVRYPPTIPPPPQEHNAPSIAGGGGHGGDAGLGEEERHEGQQHAQPMLMIAPPVPTASPTIP